MSRVYCPFTKIDNFLFLEYSFIWSSNLTFSFSKNLICGSRSLFDEFIKSTFGFALFFQYQTFVLKDALLADLCFEDFNKEELIFFNRELLLCLSPKFLFLNFLIVTSLSFK